MNKKLLNFIAKQLAVIRSEIAAERERFECTPVCDSELNTAAAKLVTDWRIADILEELIDIENRLERISRGKV